MSVLPYNRDPSSLAATGHYAKHEKQKLRGAGGGGNIYVTVNVQKPP